MRRIGIVLAASLCLLQTARAGEAPVPVRTENRPGFGRVAFDFPGPVRFRLERAGDTVAVVFTSGREMGRASGLPRNVKAVAGGPGRAEITVAAGAQIRAGRVANRIVIDVLDPAPGTAQASPPPPSPEPPVADRPGPGSAAAVPATAAPAPAPAPAPAGPVSLSAQVSSTPEGWSFAVPFEAEVGAAAFRLGDSGVVVFDQRRPIDLASVRASARRRGWRKGGACRLRRGRTAPRAR